MSWTLRPSEVASIGIDRDWLMQQIEDHRHRTNLWAFLYKLDKRFGPVDPWAEVKLAQRLMSRP